MRSTSERCACVFTSVTALSALTVARSLVVLPQDLWYFPFRPAHQIVASWTAMQKIDRENGQRAHTHDSHEAVLTGRQLH